MNCKQGDLARIVRDDYPDNVGRIVTVLRPSSDYELVAAVPGGFHWEVHCSTPLAVGAYDRIAGRLSAPFTYRNQATVLDSDLKPIRDPGDDAVDESHAWLPPVPTTKEIA
jgi:hypothetical protein